MKREEKIRQIAIEICKYRAFDPNRLVCRHMPHLITEPYMGGFFVPDLQYQMPAWRLFTSDAEIALDMVEKFNNA